MFDIAILDRNGETRIFLDPRGDHIAVRFTTDGAGYEREITLPPGSFAWERAVERANRAAAFL